MLGALRLVWGLLVSGHRDSSFPRQDSRPPPRLSTSTPTSTSTPASVPTSASTPVTASTPVSVSRFALLDNIKPREKYENRKPSTSTVDRARHPLERLIYTPFSLPPLFIDFNLNWLRASRTKTPKTQDVWIRCARLGSSGCLREGVMARYHRGGSAGLKGPEDRVYLFSSTCCFPSLFPTGLLLGLATPQDDSNAPQDDPSTTDATTSTDDTTAPRRRVVPGGHDPPPGKSCHGARRIMVRPAMRAPRGRRRTPIFCLFSSGKRSL
ncbi:hypothetical protein C8Q77DRAFT_569974 [Trametes polyzona]|nr:hypothetical protein C8Q77DRAFT_569974 [Trametes polyzona]